jgi:DNA polymerase I-like protein with 3'-5' exonuclease and polymerase domains
VVQQPDAQQEDKMTAKLNVQGLARRDKGLMSCIVADEGYMVISCDLSAGEPTVTSHFSQDENYRYATIDGVGKEPFYKNNVLMIDDIYLMVASVSPLGREEILNAWNKDWNGLTFSQQWIKDPDTVKKSLKFVRDFHKVLALGISYGMGADKMCYSAHEKGYKLTKLQAKMFIESYRQLFPKVKKLSDNLSNIIKRQAFIENTFGYRLMPKPHKAFNYLIQSSVSGLMHLILAKVFEKCPDLEFITVIHDELLLTCRDEHLERAEKCVYEAAEEVNKLLNWSVSFRIGFKTGKDWYEAK